MRKLDRFILKSFLMPFIMVFFITVFILIMQFLWVYINDLVGKGLGFWVIMEFLGWGIATILPMAMPLATLLASIMTFGNLGESNELLAMKAAGISLQRIFLPLIFVAGGISIAAFFVSNNFIPVAYNKIYTLQYDISRTKEEIKIPTGTFYNGIDGYSIRVDARDKESGMMYNVMIYNHTKNKGNISLALADSGMIRSTPDKKSLVFTLFDGVSYEETNSRNYRDTSYALQKVTFEEQEIIIALENYAFQKSDEDRYGSEIMARNLRQLSQDRDSIGGVYDQTLQNQRGKVMYELDLKFPKQFDTTYNKGYRNNYPVDSLVTWETASEELEAVENAIKSIKRAVATMNDFDREALQQTFYLRRINLEYLRKFTLAFACFIFFFIGAPLGAIIRKGGLGTPVIVSAFFFVLYYVVDIIGKKLAKDGVVSPAIGAFSSTIFLLPIGVFLTWKSTKESSIFDIETYLLPIKKFFARFSMIKRRAESSAAFQVSGHDLKIVFMGTPEFAEASLKSLVEDGMNVVAVVTVPDKKIGRGQKVGCSPVKQYAEAQSIPVLQPVSLKDPDFIAELEGYGADLFIVVAFRMLPKSVWAMPRLGTFNLHASLLPRYRGAAPINWAIINGEKETGLTTFLLDEQIDTGRILFQEKMEILPEDNAGTLYERLMTAGAELVLKTVDALAAGNVESEEQNESGVPEKCMNAPKLDRNTGKIDWNGRAGDIHNLIRGLAPKPGAHSVLKYSVAGMEELQEMELKIYASEVVADTADYADMLPMENGAVWTDGKSVFAVRCAEGVLLLKELQAPAKKRLPIKEFLAGWRGEYATFC